MDQQQIIGELEARAKALDIPMYEVCKRANVHPTTFSRWKLSDRNPEPIGATLSSLTKLQAALAAAETQGAAA